MKIKAVFLPVLLASATFAAPAMANGTIILPSDITVPYAGTGEPQFNTVSAGSVGYWVANDSGTGNSYFYTADGNWVAVIGPSASSVPNAPAALNAPVSPRTGQGLSLPSTDSYLVTELPTGGYQVFGLNSGNVFTYSDADALVGTQSAVGSPTLSGSSGFGASGGATSTTTGGTTTGSSSFGGTSGGTSSGQTTTGGTTSGSTTSTGGTSSGGGTDVPAPAVFGLFGIAAGGIALARRRRRKGA